MGRRRRKVRAKRSLKGKFLLTLTYMFFISLVLLIIGQFSEAISDSSVNEKLNDESDKRIYDEDDIASYSYETEQFFVRNLLQIVKQTPYVESGKWEFSSSEKIITDGIDTYGLVELAYYIATNKYLSEIEIFRETILDCPEVKREELVIGDIGVSILPGGNIYGVCVGNYGSYPLFIYACSLPDKDFPDGSVYLSYDKNICNDLFAGMYPVAFDKYIRLPEMSYKADTGVDLATYLPSGIIPSQEYDAYATAAYRVGEWLRTKDKTSLIERMNDTALNDNGMYLDENYFKEYVDSYNGSLGHDNYIYVIDSYTELDNYTIVSSKVISIGQDNIMFSNTGIYSICTFYDDGSYLPAPEPSLDKYSHLYGFKPIVSVNIGDETDSIDEISTDEYSDYIIDIDSIFKNDTEEDAYEEDNDIEDQVLPLEPEL